jgi:hypothetical protein
MMAISTMALTSADLVALKAELLTDPLTYGYAAFIAANEPENCAAALYKVRLGNDGEAAITINRDNISSQELLEAIDTRDFGAPGGAAVAWFQSVTRLDTLRLFDTAGNPTRVRANLDRMINNAQGSQTRLDALAVRPGSRAEVLFGPGTVVSISDVVAALALP